MPVRLSSNMATLALKSRFISTRSNPNYFLLCFVEVVVVVHIVVGVFVVSVVFLFFSSSYSL